MWFKRVSDLGTAAALYCRLYEKVVKLDHSTLLRDLPVDATLFKRLVLTLKMCDLIEDEVLPCGKRQYLLKGAA